jgi:uncharacterized protein (DUF1919 family)
MFIKSRNLRNKDFSLVANNCMGGVLLSELGIQFNSPFINLWLYPSDFIKYLNDIEHYRNEKLVFIPSDKNYPVAKLDDIVIYFLHYKTNTEAKDKWYERSRRMNLDNLFIIMCERDGCTEEDLKNFDLLHHKNKAVFTKKPYKNILSSYYIKGCEDDNGEVGLLWNVKNKFTGSRIYDCYPFIEWFNSSVV